MSAPHSKEKLIAKILKLFNLGSSSSGTTEAEMMAAITQAKTLMARHDISESEVQTAGDAVNKASGATVNYDIGSYTAYTRKMRSFARYDEIVAICVGLLTTTRPILSRMTTLKGSYVSMKFIGTEMDVAVAAKLFLIFLQSVRARSRRQYGSITWGKEHTSYAIGFATRMAARAQEMAADLTPQEQQSTALTIRSKQDAIAAFIGETTTDKRRQPKVDNSAFSLGYAHGGDFNLGRTGLE